MNTLSPIGIFDSGIGGLTIAHAINQALPNEQIIYFGDTQHLPYGNKSIKKLKFYSQKIVNFFLTRGCKAIVFACNSASSVAYEEISREIQNSCLLFNVIEPVVKYVINDSSINHVGVIGTNATINSKTYEKQITAERKDIKISSLATPLLATLIEEKNELLYESSIIHSYLKHKQFKHIDSLILGCTHYPLIEQQINEFFNKKIQIISAIDLIGKMIKKTFQKNGLLNLNSDTPKHQFYVSDFTTIFQKKTKIFFPQSIILEEENIFS